MMRKKATIVSVLSVCLVILVLVGCAPSGQAGQGVQAPAEQKVLKLGCIMPFTGPAGLWGSSIRPGMDIYAQLINENGGVKVGNDIYKVELYYADGFEPAMSATAARSLIYDKKVNALVGVLSMGNAPVTQVSSPEKVIANLGSIGGRDVLSPDQSYAIYGYPSMEAAMNFALAIMEGFPQLHNICWAGPETGIKEAHTYAKPVDDRLKKDFGITSTRCYYPQGTLNFTPYITKMAEDGVEVVYILAGTLDICMFMKQRTAMGHKWPILQMSAPLDYDTLRGIVGSDEAMQNLVVDYPVPWEFKKVTVAPKYLDMSKRIWAKYQETYKKDMFIGAFGGTSITSMGQYLEAVQQAGTIDPDAVMRTIRAGTFDSFMGRYTTSGKTTAYGSNVCYGYPCCLGVLKGKKFEYLSEHPLMDVEHPFVPETKD
jgi:branched-chain amino acid transport system substrate-binding protein